MTAIACCGLGKTHGHYRVFHEVNLAVARGECFALFGPNGAGKTTLLHILAALQRPSEGHYEILGMRGGRHTGAIRARLMLLAHGAHVYDELTAGENIAFALALRGARPTAREIKQALDRAQIGAFADMQVRRYSAGMKRRLALARLMAARPDILLLDEPFAALDDAGAAVMRDYITERVSAGGAVLMATHDRDNALPVATRAGRFRQGTLHEIAPADLHAHV